ncbi:unnamed protein product, partial [Gulo gulo]
TWPCLFPASGHPAPLPGADLVNAGPSGLTLHGVLPGCLSMPACRIQFYLDRCPSMGQGAFFSSAIFRVESQS